MANLYLIVLKFWSLACASPCMFESIPWVPCSFVIESWRVRDSGVEYWVQPGGKRLILRACMSCSIYVDCLGCRKLGVKSNVRAQLLRFDSCKGAVAKRRMRSCILPRNVFAEQVSEPGEPRNKVLHMLLLRLKIGLSRCQHRARESRARCCPSVSSLRIYLRHDCLYLSIKVFG